MAAKILEVRVKPRARTPSLVEGADGTWVARLRSPPAEGRANRELVALVAAHFGCPKSAVTILRGTTSRTKRLRVETL